MTVSDIVFLADTQNYIINNPVTIAEINIIVNNAHKRGLSEIVLAMFWQKAALLSANNRDKAKQA